jgi:hypothetical protein
MFPHCVATFIQGKKKHRRSNSADTAAVIGFGSQDVVTATRYERHRHFSSPNAKDTGKSCYCFVVISVLCGI